MLNKKKNNKGFTLVELLVVIAIIGILAVVAVPALFSNIEKSKVARLEGNISAIKSAALSYYADNSEFYETTTTSAEALDKTELGTYLESLTTVFNTETYTIEGTTTSSTGSVLTINIPKQLGQKSVDKLANDLGLTTASGAVTNLGTVSEQGLKIKIIDKK